MRRVRELTTATEHAPRVWPAGEVLDSHADQRPFVAAAQRILIVKPSSLGDIIHALPTVARIRRGFPQAHIAWLVSDAFLPLLRQCPVIDSLIPFARHDHRQLPGLCRQLRGGRFDMVVDLQGLFRSGLFTGVTGAPRRIGLGDAREGSRLFYNEVVPVRRMHAVDRYLLAADHLQCPAMPAEFPLGLDTNHCQRTLVAISPSARRYTKLWGDDRFTQLARQLPPERVVLTGSSSEAQRVAKIAADMRPHVPRNLAGKTDLLELAQLYRQCAVVVTNDSGPLHLAAALGTPVIAIFGPTDPFLTGPYGGNHVVLRTDLPCAPCFRKKCNHTPAMECMTKISVDQVLAAIRRFI